MKIFESAITLWELQFHLHEKGLFCGGGSKTAMKIDFREGIVYKAWETSL